MRAIVFVVLTFLTCALGSDQKKILTSTIAISYSPKSDTVARNLMDISLSGATFALLGKEGRWEKDFALIGEDAQRVEFAGFDPRNSHTISVRLRHSELLNGRHPGKFYVGGEAFIYQIPKGAHEYALLPVSCDGKKVDVWATYALVTADEERGISPLGYEKGCKGRWGLLK